MPASRCARMAARLSEYAPNVAPECVAHVVAMLRQPSDDPRRTPTHSEAGRRAHGQHVKATCAGSDYLATRTSRRPEDHPGSNPDEAQKHHCGKSVEHEQVGAPGAPKWKWPVLALRLTHLAPQTGRASPCAVQPPPRTRRRTASQGDRGAARVIDRPRARVRTPALRHQPTSTPASASPHRPERELACCVRLTGAT